MKTINFRNPRLVIAALTILVLMAGNALAQDSTTSSPTDTAQPVVSPPAPQLSYGVPEILQLSQAKVGDSTIINYIRNSGNNYGLNAAQIIYLRQQGVSDAVLNAMLNQRTQTAQAASIATTSQAVDANVSSAPTATVVTQPAVTYVQTVPTSSVYIIPDTQTYHYNTWLYYHSPYYTYYPAYHYWPYPAVSFSLGWGSGWAGYRGAYHGGWHSGGYHRGGFHGRGGYHH